MKTASSAHARGSRILIAEDSATQAAQLQHLLEKEGYLVVLAPNGKVAIERARQQTPDLIISDVDMPLLGGYGMCRALKQDATLKSVPVILLTSLSDLEDVIQGLEAGADHYLTKPYQADYLLMRVREILENPPPATAADAPFQVVINGKTHAVTADPRQVLTLLLSTYSNAVQRNKELIESQRQLNHQNQLLDQTAQSERRAHEALKETQAQLVQSEKMAGLGQLVAGIAHEINNPLSFVSNNMAVLQRDVTILREVLDLYRSAEAGLAGRADLLDPIHEIAQRTDLPYTIRNLNEMLDRSRDGLKRIEQIVNDLRDFVRLDENQVKEADLNHSIESTVNIIRSRAKGRQVEVELELNPLPPVPCYLAKINQVIMNLVANAIDASAVGGKVVVRSATHNSEVGIDVIDHGSGIPAAIRDKIFDPFFTTKPPGQGTGLGLSISFGIVRDHGGRIEVDSKEGAGSRFTVYIPLQANGKAEDQKKC